MSIETARGRPLRWILVFVLTGLPSFVLRLSGADLDPTLTALVYGLGIVGGAFLLSWAAEAAQLDVSASLAIAVLALIAILPEYAIEAVLAWDAGNSFDPASGEVTDEMGRVAANVTGANRLLIGIGWSAVILIFWIKRRRLLDLRGHLSLEMPMLIVATLLTFLIFFMDQVNIVVAAVLIAMYLFYLWASSRREPEEPELVGPALLIGSLPAVQRRTVVALMFAYSAAVILMAAEPFVDSLVDTGQELGIDDFILIQWIAPLASEAPEIIVAILFSLRANPVAGITTLISAEVNQLTLLIGSMVLIFSTSGRSGPQLPRGLTTGDGIPSDVRRVGLRHPADPPPSHKLEGRPGAPGPFRRPSLLPGREPATHLRLHLPRSGGGPGRPVLGPGSRHGRTRDGVA